MKTIKSLKEITTLEVGDVVIFGNLTCHVARSPRFHEFYLSISNHSNDRIFEILNLKKRDFIEELGIDARFNCDFPETKSLEALTAIVSALFKEYERQSKQLTYEDICYKLFEKGHYYIDSTGDIRFFQWPNDCPGNAITKHQLECIVAKNKLANVARYLNGDWREYEDSHSSVYKYIIWYNLRLDTLAIKESSNYIEYTGNILFKSPELAQKAIEILGEETVKLALTPLY